jgi:hypothetical protein
MEQINSRAEREEFREAFSSIRMAKNVFWSLVLAAVLVQLASFVLVRYMRAVDVHKMVADAAAVVRPAAPAPAVAPALAPAPAAATKPGKAAKTKPASAPVVAPAESQPASAPATEPALATAGTTAEPPTLAVPESTWAEILRWTLPATKFLALVVGTLLVLTLLFAVKLALIGRTGGVAAFISAFFWSLILWVVLVPWQQIYSTSMAGGALYNLTDLVNGTASLYDKQHTGADVWLYYGRFLIYPLLALALLARVQMKFARGLRKVIGAEVADMGKLEEKL